MNVVDTSGWIEFLFEGNNADVFAPLIEDVDNLLVPVICLYEVFKKVNTVSDEGRALRAIAQMKQGRMTEISEEIALKGSLVSLRYRIPMADSLIYATAQMLGAVLWTQDEHFRQLPNVNYKEARAKTTTRRPTGRA